MSAVTPHKGAQPTPAALAPTVAAATVFVASGAVLVLEILAVRLLAPYVGLTLETTTSIIGAVLAGIAVGAAVGGWIADRHEPRRLVVWLLIGGGLLALLIVPIVRALGPEARGRGDAAALGITLLALVPSAAVLSAVSPTVARLQLRDLSSGGTMVGRLSAFATAGALLGTFVTGFLLVPLMPVTSAVLGTGAVLVVGGLVLGIASGSLRRAPAVGAAAAALALAFLTATRDSPCEIDSTHHCAAVVVSEDDPNGRILLIDGLSNSYVNLTDPSDLRWPYAQWTAAAIDATAPVGRPLDGVFVGGGGFTLPRWLLATRPGSHATVLEVDSRLVELVKKRMGLKAQPGLETIIGDGRMTMRELRGGSVDFVVGDAFSHYVVPWHLATREWLDEVKRVLKPGGLFTVNVFDMRPNDLLRAEIATILERFHDVAIVAFPGTDALPAGGNAIVIASDRPLPTAATANPADGATSYRRPALEHYTADATPLRDDYAPIDQLLTPRRA